MTREQPVVPRWRESWAVNKCRDEGMITHQTWTKPWVERTVERSRNVILTEFQEEGRAVALIPGVMGTQASFMWPAAGRFLRKRMWSEGPCGRKTEKNMFHSFDMSWFLPLCFHAVFLCSLFLPLAAGALSRVNSAIQTHKLNYSDWEDGSFYLWSSVSWSDNGESFSFRNFTANALFTQKLI